MGNRLPAKRSSPESPAQSGPCDGCHATDATPWRPGEDHHRQVRRAERHGGEQRAPEDGGLPRRVAQRVSRHAGFWGADYGAVGAGATLSTMLGGMDKGCRGDCPVIEVDPQVQSPSNTNIDAVVVVMECLRNGEVTATGVPDTTKHWRT